MYPKPRQEQAFTLLEIVVVVAILVVLAALIIPMARQLLLEAKAQRIIETYETLKQAVHRFYLDTGKFPVETSGTPLAPVFDAPNHELSMDNGILGWQGPYLDQPLSLNANPSGDQVRVGKNLNEANGLGGGTGFYFAWSTAWELGDGSFVRFDNISEEIAKLVDEDIDQGVTGDWKEYGKVRFIPEAAGEADLFLFILK